MKRTTFVFLAIVAFVAIVAIVAALVIGLRPPETFEAEGIRLHDAKEACLAEMAHNNDPSLTRKCLEIWAADDQHTIKAQKLRASGIIR